MQTDRSRSSVDSGYNGQGRQTVNPSGDANNFAIGWSQAIEAN